MTADEFDEFDEFTEEPEDQGDENGCDRCSMKPGQIAGAFGVCCACWAGQGAPQLLCLCPFGSIG